MAPTRAIRSGVGLANLGYALPGSVLAVSIMLAFSYLDRELVIGEFELAGHGHPIVGIVNALSPAPPSGQRWVTVFARVQKRTPSMPCWLVSPNAERFQPPKL